MSLTFLPELLFSTFNLCQMRFDICFLIVVSKPKIQENTNRVRSKPLVRRGCPLSVGFPLSRFIDFSHFTAPIGHLVLVWL